MAEIIGLAISICSFLELALHTTNTTLSLVDEYHAVGHDFHTANIRLEHDLAALRTWMSFWGVNTVAAEERFVHLWGPEGRSQMLGSLGQLKERSDAANVLLKRYRDEFELRRSAKPLASKFREKLWGNSSVSTTDADEETSTGLDTTTDTNGLSELARRQQAKDSARIKDEFRKSKKVKFIFSGKKQLNEHLDELRKQLNNVREDSTMLFFAAHRHIAHGQLSADRIDKAVLEASDESFMHVARVVRKASESLYVTLQVGNDAFDNMELGLLSSRFDEACCQALDIPGPFLKKSVKFPLLVAHAVQKRKCSCAYVAEVDVWARKDGDLVHSNEDREFQSILQDCTSRGKASFILSSPVHQNLTDHCHILHRASSATTSRLSLPADASTAPVSLQKLFQELMESDYRSSRGTFPLKKRLELAYMLALSVLQIQSTWFRWLDSNSVLQRGNSITGRGFETSLRISDHRCRFGSTPFDKFIPPKRVEVFQLGVVLFEIGMGEGVGSRCFEDAEDLIDEMYSEMLPAYAGVVEICLRGEMCAEEDEYAFMELFLKNVVEPLRALTQPGAMMRQRRAKRGTR